MARGLGVQLGLQVLSCASCVLVQSRELEGSVGRELGGGGVQDTGRLAGASKGAQSGWAAPPFAERKVSSSSVHTTVTGRAPKGASHALPWSPGSFQKSVYVLSSAVHHDHTDSVRHPCPDATWPHWCGRLTMSPRVAHHAGLVTPVQEGAVVMAVVGSGGQEP